MPTVPIIQDNRTPNATPSESLSPGLSQPIPTPTPVPDNPADQAIQAGISQHLAYQNKAADVNLRRGLALSLKTPGRYSPDEIAMMIAENSKVAAAVSKYPQFANQE